MRFKHFILAMLFINIFFIGVYSQNKNNEEIIKVGVYEYEPYISVDKNRNISGYFDEFFELINKKLNIKYEYVLCNISDGLEKLKKEEIDILIGIPIIIKDKDNIIFNKYSISEEKFGIFTNKNIDLESLEEFDEVTLGLVEEDYNAMWALDFFESINIKVKSVYGKNYKELEKLMEKDKIDLMIDSLYKRNKYKMIYEFAGNQVFVAGNENSKKILNNIDKVMEEYGPVGESPISKLYNKYFNKTYREVTNRNKILYIILIILSLLSIILIIFPLIKKIIIKNKIRYRINSNKYLLQYQPIYNPRDKSVVGFEGLLRLLDEEGKLIPPFKFIPEIEKNGMLFDISIWVLKRAISDHNKIKDYDNMKVKDFYISINVSLNEIENNDFVNRIIEILSNSNLGANKICLEIIERVKINDINKIIKNINYLRKAGFKIAIDDFGVEYSNLDVLHKLYVDTIKIDKNFVDGIGKDVIKDETILFISRIAKAKNKHIVLEGIEELQQDIEIKKIENDYLYVQGYYYNKPMYIDDIKNI